LLERDADGITEVAEQYLEPGGAMVVGFVRRNSPKHKLLKRLAAIESEDDPLTKLKLPIVAAIDWQGQEESLMMMYRRPFQTLWPEAGWPNMDEDDVYFEPKKGSTWKESAVRKFLLANAFPTINVRVMERKDDVFPSGKYLDPRVNKVGAALIFANLTDDKAVTTQWAISRVLRKHAERYRGKIHFSFVERTKNTRQLRQDVSMGVNPNVEAEMMVFEGTGSMEAVGGDLNYWHGDPKKYRLQNMTEAAVDEFFAKYDAGELPTYWISREPWTYTGKSPPSEATLRIAGVNFDKTVLEEDPKIGKLVAFFNDDPLDGCEMCAEGRKVWEEVAQHVKSHRGLAGKVVIAALDQSKNEHPETLVPQKVAQPLVVYYPPGPNPAKRWKKRRILSRMAERFFKDPLIEIIEDMVMDSDNDEL